MDRAAWGWTRGAPRNSAKRHGSGLATGTGIPVAQPLRGAGTPTPCELAGAVGDRRPAGPIHNGAAARRRAWRLRVVQLAGGVA